MLADFAFVRVEFEAVKIALGIVYTHEHNVLDALTSYFDVRRIFAQTCSLAIGANCFAAVAR